MHCTLQDSSWGPEKCASLKQVRIKSYFLIILFGILICTLSLKEGNQNTGVSFKQVTCAERPRGDVCRHVRSTVEHWVNMYSDTDLVPQVNVRCNTKGRAAARETDVPPRGNAVLARREKKRALMRTDVNRAQFSRFIHEVFYLLMQSTVFGVLVHHRTVLPCFYYEGRRNYSLWWKVKHCKWTTGIFTVSEVNAVTFKVSSRDPKQNFHEQLLRCGPLKHQRAMTPAAGSLQSLQVQTVNTKVALEISGNSSR